MFSKVDEVSIDESSPFGIRMNLGEGREDF